MLLQNISNQTTPTPFPFTTPQYHHSYFAKLRLTVMTVGVQATLNTPPPAPLRTLAPPWSTAGALRALLRAPWAGAPCTPQGPHVQLPGGRGCQVPRRPGGGGKYRPGDPGATKLPGDQAVSVLAKIKKCCLYMSRC